MFPSTTLFQETSTEIWEKIEFSLHGLNKKQTNESAHQVTI